jgi:glycosyltransferase involved in cell wall biosynthesis
MGYPLAVFNAWIGVPSETFIRRHMQELLPGGTVVVAWDTHPAPAGRWQVDSPALVLRKLPPHPLARRLLRVAGRKLGWDSPPRADAVKQFLEENQVKVILAEYLDYGLTWVEFARNQGVRFFAHAHGYDVSRLLRVRKWRTAYRRYNQAEGVISMSHFAAEELAAAGVARHKIHVIPYGVDVPDEPSPRPGGEPIRCLAVGRMIGKKAPLLTLEAFRRASKACPALRLDYAGGGPLLPAAQQFVREHGLGDRVALHGPQPNTEVKRFLREADIFLQHSVRDPETGDEEGLPVSILEAMAQSLPVVSTRHAGIPEAVCDGLTGYLVDERDCPGMAERLLALARDPDLRHHMGVAGWQRAKDHFTWERERKELLDIMDLHESV